MWAVANKEHSMKMSNRKKDSRNICRRGGGRVCVCTFYQVFGRFNWALFFYFTLLVGRKK